MTYIRYLQSLLWHKWYVFRAGLRVGVPIWRLVIHDWSKFMPIEFIPYARNFYGGGDPDGFDRAWLHHQKFNPHHWQYYILIQDFDEPKALDMPEVFVREMVADWMGASMAYTGSWDMHEWLEDRLPKICEYMSHGSVRLLEHILMEAGYQLLILNLMETEITPAARIERLR